MSLTSEQEGLTCREVEEFVLEYFEGRLASKERARFETHLVTCTACTTYLAAYRVTIALGKEAFVHPAEPAGDHVPEDLIKAILDARVEPS